MIPLRQGFGGHVPEFSPDMLRFFLRARVAFAHMERRRGNEHAAAQRELGRLRKLARLTHAQAEFAWMGRLNNADARTRLWAVLGHFPCDFGIVLDDRGGQARPQAEAATAARRSSDAPPERLQRVRQNNG